MEDVQAAELKRIVAEHDRSATFSLLDQLTDPCLPADDHDEIVHALAVLADPRAVDRLVTMADDTAHHVDVRGSALDVLADSGLCPERDVLRQWWASGDVELQKQALIEAERTEVDIIGSVARDPSHPLHEQAIWGLEFGFEEPEWQHCKVRALSHASAGVRRAAARTLLWDEPIAAEAALQEAASDEDEGVAVAAMGPVWEVLDFTGAELQPQPPLEASSSGGPTSRVAPPPAARIIEAFSDLDGPWQPKLDVLRRPEWSAAPGSERAELTSFFVGHPDPAVRALAGPALAAWDDVDRLLELAHDPVSFVRKGAVYHLHDVSNSSAVAELTWRLISTGEIASTRGSEALRTYAAHAPRAEVIERLIDLALHDQRESLRYEAVCLLGRPDIGSVLTLLTEPALMTWDVHSMLLTICASDEIAPPPLNHLRDVDDLEIAAGLAHLQ